MKKTVRHLRTLIATANAAVMLCSQFFTVTTVKAGSTYSAGQIVTNNFSFTARYALNLPNGRYAAAGSPVYLQDFAGSIVFFEWFAAWCPYCQAAVPQVQTGIEQWYASRGGNPTGIPVIVVEVNQESGAGFVTATDAYFSSHGVTSVVNDFAALNSVNFVKPLFTPGGGQPLFVCINGVTNSPNTPAWQVMINSLNYGQTMFTSTLATFRTTIDAVQRPASPPSLSVPRRIGNDFTFFTTTQSNHTYIVQCSTNMTSWQTLYSFNGLGTTVNIRHTNAPAGGALYRVSSQ